MFFSVHKNKFQNRLDYIGHSMGTTMLYLMVSSFPEMAQHIRTANMLAPVYDLKELTGLVGLQPVSLALRFLDALEFFGIHTVQFPR